MLITDGSLEINLHALNQICTACESHLPSLQLREKEMDSRRLWELADMFRKITSKYSMFLSINERIDIALSVGADGVHLSEMGLSPQVPKKLKPSLIIGVSVHNIENGLRAEQEGADYLIFGPIFPTPSKKAFGLPQGIANLKQMVKKVSIPILAVGGIIPSNAKECLDAGAYGIAAMGAFQHSKDIKKTVNDFRESLNEIKD